MIKILEKYKTKKTKLIFAIMSKSALKNYLTTLPKKELGVQLLDLYNRFPAVKEYYDFIFNPKEEKRVQEAKVKIANEFFPIRRKKPKARRSLAQKVIKHFITLGLNPFLVADVMLYAIEIAQSYSEEKNVNDVFYRSILKSYQQAVSYVIYHQFTGDFKLRIEKIYRTAEHQNWPFIEDFSMTLNEIEVA